MPKVESVVNPYAVMCCYTARWSVGVAFHPDLAESCCYYRLFRCRAPWVLTFRSNTQPGPKTDAINVL